MDPLSVAGSVAGIIALGLQLSSTLQEYIETAGGAPERLRQIVIELQATAHGIKDLNDFLDWDRAHEPRIISQYGEKDFHHVIEQCDAIFRKVTVCVAKAWRSALDAVDEFHPLEPQILSIELSSIERLALPWNLREIGQYILDLDRLRQFLHFRLTVALLGENLRRPSHRFFPSVNFEKLNSLQLDVGTLWVAYMMITLKLRI
ncbi:MAG: hypothetical protein LQ342_001589 [Letrouitia transgressa]|nr:MAG: hypothetical protein LQ342_001589 [Letrouitia transgressa]